jgi:hypothetical protein
MPSIRQIIDIHAPQADLFHLTQDYRRRLEWDPFLREARLLDGADEAAVGARAWCVAWCGLGMETEYITFKPCSVTAVRMTEGPSFLANFAGSWRFEAIGDQTTRVIFCYVIRPSWFCRFLGPLLRMAFQFDMRRRLLALKRFCETQPA